MSHSVSSASRRLNQLLAAMKPCSLHHQPSDPTSPPLVQVTPSVSLIDQKVHVRVQGLPAKAKVTVHLRTQQEWRRSPAVFVACGHFVASDEGDLDLDRDASVGGTYTGLDPMGLFWSLVPCPRGPQNIRLVVRNGEDPVLYTLVLYLGHWPLTDLVAKDTTLTPMCSTMVTRWKKAKDVRRIPVREGAVRGALFLPPGEGPHPGVIDMFGGAGGLMEIRASLLSSHGFAVLALPFFNYQDLPKKPRDIRFDYFEEAVEWLSSHRAVKAGGIGAVGVSAGGLLALTMAWQCPQVKAIVSINSTGAYHRDTMYRKDGSIVKKGVLEREIIHTAEGLDIRHTYPAKKDDLVPVWESSAHILMLASDDDYQADPHRADFIHSCYPEDQRHLVEVVHYPGAGHLLEPPYTPHCRSCVNPIYAQDMLWGGNPVDHAAAQEQSWHKILTFLHTHLS